MRLENALPGQLRKAIEEGRPVLLPAGCVEFHGPHLPLGCDAIIVEELAQAVAARTGAVAAPPLWYGPTGYAVTGPEHGTMDGSVARFGDHAQDVLLALWRLGFRRIIVLLHHQGLDGPEGLALRRAAAEIAIEQGVQQGGEGWWGRPDFRALEHVFGRIVVLASVQPEAAELVRGDHAGATETSLMLHLRPESCDLSLLDPDEYHFLATAPQGSAERGRLMFEAMAETLVKATTQLCHPERA
jgi:creatinine amidohydrolase